jgi:4-hydroxy-tetrahydrodipicolinate synthase
MLKHEDFPGMRKLSEVREQSASAGRRRISILVGNGGLFLPQEMLRGADGAMTGFAYPEMLVQVCKLFDEGRQEEAEDLFNVYLPLLRHEFQYGIGLALRKETLRRRGAIRSAYVRRPGPVLNGIDMAELGRLIQRLESRLAERA